MSQTALILGATSGIARALAGVLAQRGRRLILAARDEEELERIAADLRLRHEADVATERFDALDFNSHEAFIERCIAQAEPGGLDAVVLCYGYMPPPDKVPDEEQIQRTFEVNCISAATVLERIATHMSERGRGLIAGISSVAGDRGRQSNYIYGASKAAMSAYLQGLRNRLYRSGVHVLTIKPGIVHTPMTEGWVNPKSPLVATPERVARDIERAMRRRRNVIYTPWFWRVIMRIIRGIPEFIFKRMKL